MVTINEIASNNFGDHDYTPNVYQQLHKAIQFLF